MLPFVESMISLTNTWQYSNWPAAREDELENVNYWVTVEKCNSVDFINYNNDWSRMLKTDKEQIKNW